VRESWVRKGRRSPRDDDVAAEPVRDVDHLDLDDGFVAEREAERADDPAGQHDGESRCAVHQRGPDETGLARVPERIAGYRVRAAAYRFGIRCGARVAEHDVWVQDRDERAEVALAERGEEGVGGLPLAGEVGVACGRYPAHPAAGAAGQLAGGGRRALDDGSDLVEGSAKMSCRTKARRSAGGEGVEHDHRPPRGGRARRDDRADRHVLGAASSQPPRLDAGHACLSSARRRSVALDEVHTTLVAVLGWYRVRIEQPGDAGNAPPGADAPHARACTA
jgi:hypothetical protein